MWDSTTPGIEEGPMGLSFLVWDVEKFKATRTARIRSVADHIKNQNPDVLCILEFMGKFSARSLSEEGRRPTTHISFLQKYDFGLTDSKNASKS